MTPIEVAAGYIARGWNPVPVPFRTKGPQDSGWQTRVIGAETVHRHFNAAPANVGLIMGPTSKGLTDVDLDCPEAIDVAAYLLPKTGAIFGRASARASHWLYTTTLGETSESAVYAFDDPDVGDRKKARLVELRCGGVKGCQTIAPGSVHESGEPIGWDESGDPAVEDGAALLLKVRLVAVAALMARAWPPEGQRHDAARILGGFLARARIPTPTVKLIAEAVVRAIGDREQRERRAAAADAAEAFKAGGKAYGYPALRELIGDRRAAKIAEWIGYDSAADASNPDAEPSAGMAAQAALIKPTAFVWEDPSAFPCRQWLLGFDYCRRYLSGLISPGASGKTSLMLIEALVLVTGRPLLGVKPRETVKVWYFNGEDPREEVMRRLLAAMKHYRIPREEVEGRLFIDSGRDMPISIAETGKDGTRVAVPTVDAITRNMVALGIDVMLVDPFVSTHGVGENDNVAINLVARQWGLIAERTNAAIGLAHHARKPGGETVTTETSRGASSLMDAVRMGRALNKMTRVQAEELGIEEPNRYFRIGGPDSPGKPNMAPPVDKTKWFKIESVDLENAPRTGNVFEHIGAPASDHVGVVTTWEPPSLIDNVQSVAQIEEIQRRATAGKWRKSQQSVDEPWIGLLVAEVLDRDVNKPGERRAIRKLLAMWMANKALVEYEAKDSHGEFKPYVRGGPGG